MKNNLYKLTKWKRHSRSDKFKINRSAVQLELINSTDWAAWSIAWIDCIEKSHQNILMIFYSKTGPEWRSIMGPFRFRLAHFGPKFSGLIQIRNWEALKNERLRNFWGNLSAFRDLEQAPATFPPSTYREHLARISF